MIILYGAHREHHNVDGVATEISATAETYTDAVQQLEDQVPDGHVLLRISRW